MRCTLLSLFILIAYSSSALAESVKPSNASGDSARGKFKADDNRCIECHGLDGNGLGQATGAAGKFAKLAGQYPDYLIKQLNDFRSGARKHDLMSIIAKDLDNADVLDIATYYAQLPKMQATEPSADKDKAIYSQGKLLFSTGDAARGILACASCHGLGGEGIDTLKPRAPVIGGQDFVYLEKQLQDWRSVERRNSEGGVMNALAKGLQDTDIQALATYISSLPESKK